MKRTSKILFILLIAILVFLSVGTSLQFSLNGDDWFALWRYIKDFTSLRAFFDIKNYSTDYSNYVFANILMGVIYKIWGFSPFPYYFISMLLRVMAAVSFYFLVNKAAKNKLAGILSAMLFTVMFAGIETTNWVFNMNTYLSLALLNTFLAIFYTSNNKLLSKETLLQALLLTATFYTAPTRMHGIFFLLPLLALFKIKKFTFKNIVSNIAAIVILLFPVLLIRFLTRETTDQGYFQIFSQVFSSPPNILTNFSANLAHAFISDQLLLKLTGEYKTQAQLLIAAYVFIFIFFYRFRKIYPLFFRFACLTLLIPPIFIIIPWLINPIVVMPTDHRYQLIPGAYLMVLFAMICTILWQFKKGFLKGLALILFFSVFFQNLFALRSYFSLLADNGRLAEDSNKQFSYIKSEIQVPDNSAPLVFLITPDSFYLYNAISFGFPYHMMLIDQRFGIDVAKAPFVADNMKSLIDVLSSPESSELYRYGYKPIQIPLENVYVFKLQNRQLSNITTETRDYLKETLSNLK